MKNKMIFVFIFLIAFGLIVNSYRFLEDGPFYTKFIKSTDLSNEIFDKVELHDNINTSAYTKRFGKPSEKDDNDAYDYYFWKNGLTTASIINGENKGEIVRLAIGNINDSEKQSDLKTSKGIGLGDSKEKIISLYGPNYFKYVEQGCDTIGYVDRKNKKILEFWLADKVVEIRLDDLNMD